MAKKSEIQSQLHTIRENRKLTATRYNRLGKALQRLKDDEEALEAQLKRLEEKESNATSG